MKKALILILFLSASFAYCAEPIQLASMNPYVAGVGASAASCTDINALSTYGGNYDTYSDLAGREHAQKVKFSGTSCTIKSVTVGLASVSSTTVHLEIWNGVDRDTASQIGGDSPTESVTSSSGSNTVTFTWTANKATVTADYYIHIVKDGGDAMIILYATDEYEDTNYDYCSGDNCGADSNEDIRFSVDYE